MHIKHTYAVRYESIGVDRNYIYRHLMYWPLTLQWRRPETRTEREVRIDRQIGTYFHYCNFHFVVRI